MKIIALTNWILLGGYAILLAYLALTLNQSGTDAAGKGMAVGYLFVGAVLLGAVLGLNLLPFRAAKLAVFVALLAPVVLGLREAALNWFYAQRAKTEEQGRWDGSYYFNDPNQRRVAEALATDNLASLKTLLPDPHWLNQSGAEHITLLDFAALRATSPDASPASWQSLEWLMANGATLETADSLHTPTHVLVVRQSSVKQLEWFLKKGADPNAKHHQNEDTPALFAAMDDPEDRLAKVALLLTYGADPNSIYPPAASGWLAGHSALLAAARQEWWDVCRVLLEHGANPAVVGPQKLVFRELIDNRARMYAESGTIPPTFLALQKQLEKHDEKPSNQ